ncbi:hypothetical protein NPN14_23775, partial [Vibrio parahaemolyticus]|uniref:hypothetical protein n=1 Tax=Vibrio parahaemolyticus TaxID=670 RepID=UPI0021113CA4
KTASLTPPKHSVGDAVCFVVRQKALLHLVIAQSLITLVATGAGTWAPAFFMRVQGYSVSSIGLILAAMGVGTFVIMALTGPLADRLARRDER